MEYSRIALKDYLAALEFRFFVLLVDLSWLTAEEFLLVHFCAEVFENHRFDFFILDVKDVPSIVEFPLLLDLKVTCQILPIVVY